jgi:hypothetical protein
MFVACQRMRMELWVSHDFCSKLDGECGCSVCNPHFGVVGLLRVDQLLHFSCK